LILVPVYRLSRQAEGDIVLILARSERQFGPEARDRYQALIGQALRAVAMDAACCGSQLRPELGDCVRTDHLRHVRGGRAARRVTNPRHLLLCRSIQPGVIGIGRVLHDAMELSRHLPDDDGEA
jgi:toxin ParE1/3/4